MRKELLNQNEVKEWKTLASGYRVGFKYMGEFHMLSEWAKIIVLNPQGQEVFNFGELAFTNRFEGYNYYLTDTKGRFLLLDWMFFKAHAHMVTVLFDLFNNTFIFLDTTTLLDPHSVELKNGRIRIVCTENFWINGERAEKLNDYLIDPETMEDIEKFYSLNENDVKVRVINWLENGKVEVSYE